MSEEEDLDLQALQRQLDDAFQTTRPRPAFEDELWLRMQARRPILSRFRDSLTGLIDGLREAPAVPSAAVAILLIVVVGAGIFTLSGLHPGAGSSSTTAGALHDTGGTKYGPTAPEYGSLPPPSLSGSGATPVTTPTQSAFSGPTYLGPASLTWAGTLQVAAASLPVFRYQEPTLAAADEFATSIGAAPAAKTVTGALGTYSSGDGIELVVYGSVAQPAREPTFVLYEAKLASAPVGDPVREATAYLGAHSLIPTWPYQTQVQKVGVTTRVEFLRSFDVPTQGLIKVVDGAGERYGIEVDLVGGQSRVLETGPLPLTLDSASYPIITSDQAVRAALATSATSSAATPYPAVTLTKAELVYKLVWAGDHSFYEPAFLFSGTFTDHGVVKVKRVLVPAVGPSFLSP
jgi:hypothetical protein